MEVPVAEPQERGAKYIHHTKLSNIFFFDYFDYLDNSHSKKLK